MVDFSLTLESNHKLGHDHVKINIKIHLLDDNLYKNICIAICNKMVYTQLNIDNFIIYYKLFVTKILNIQRFSVG
jgi:hypothetical protein